MLHLFDANVLITAHNLYYPIEAVPEFWAWIEHQAERGQIKMPVEILEEVLAGGKKTDALPGWISGRKGVLQLDEDVDPALLRRVLEEGYGKDLKDHELQQIGRDPFLIAYALARPSERCVVTVEVSKTSWIRGKRKLPDACASLAVRCENPFPVYRSLGFTTFWNRS